MLQAFSIAFDDPTLAISTFIKSIFDSGTMKDAALGQNRDKHIDVSEFYTKEIVADCIASAIENITDDELDLFMETSEVSKVVSQMKSETGLILSEDGNIKSVKFLSEVLKGIGNGIKISNEMNDIVESSLTDYTASKHYLQVIKAALQATGNDDAVLMGAIDNIEFEYDNWFIVKFKDYLAGKVSGKIIGQISKTVGSGSFSLVNYIREGLNIASGNKTRAALLKKINGTMIISYPLAYSYTYYANKIYDGTYNAGDVIQCEKLFELCKALRISEYNNVINLDRADRSLTSYRTELPTRFNEMSGKSEEEMLTIGCRLLQDQKF